MKRLSILVVAIVLIAGVKPSLPQSSTSTSSSGARNQAKVDKKAERAKAKATKQASRAHVGKKSTSTQDAAYTLAYMFGRPKA
jgi:hypothetical protein